MEVTVLLYECKEEPLRRGSGIQMPWEAQKKEGSDPRKTKCTCTKDCSHLLAKIGLEKIVSRASSGETMSRNTALPYKSKSSSSSSAIFLRLN